MARSNFGPEVKAAMAEKSKTTGKKAPPGRDAGDSAAEMKRDAKMGITQGSPQDMQMDMGQGAQMGPQIGASMGPQIGASHPPTPASVAQHSSVSQPNPAHAAIAASIAHAILGKGGM